MIFGILFSSQTEDYLKRKIRSRPERSELVRMHILEGACFFLICFFNQQVPVLSKSHILSFVKYLDKNRTKSL